MAKNWKKSQALSGAKDPRSCFCPGYLRTTAEMLRCAQHDRLQTVLAWVGVHSRCPAALSMTVGRSGTGKSARSTLTKSRNGDGDGGVMRLPTARPRYSDGMGSAGSTRTDPNCHG